MEERRVTPFRMVGNIYFIGTNKYSCHLIDTGEGYILIDTGYLAAMDASCDMEIKQVPGLKNMFFGGEGIFNTVVTGPGKVWIQSMPINKVAGALLPYIPTSSGN